MSQSHQNELVISSQEFWFQESAYRHTSEVV